MNRYVLPRMQTLTQPQAFPELRRGSWRISEELAPGAWLPKNRRRVSAPRDSEIGFGQFGMCRFTHIGIHRTVAGRQLRCTRAVFD